ncbi:LysR family transcriptional regulator [Alcaligenes endophyticus]|uniref:LysR family transcriptional regulator n=1 Tax=Alcaligenes endophyticus TaxID=1929088 RepID=A0ABT8EL57_9BURK|nr:LysR family transcriptional regulator [Alcaligenes endophyticus]MCX5590603.1 LysR family transcriptional regulator [Alcaligenes endophyticus]MDN4122033.1 LysR family transcriptional regulator [Alcaligenes endophyticus]
MTYSAYRIISALRMRQFELLCVLAETANMRLAAERLHLSTAAVSKSLGDIEHQLGVTLFQRQARGLVPTAAGNTVLKRARVLLSEVALLADDLQDEREGRLEVLRIGAPPFVAWTLLPEVLSELRAAGASHAWQIVEGRLADMQHKLLHHEIDALLTMNTPSELGQLNQEQIVIQPICDEHWIVVCSPQYRAGLCIATEQAIWPQLRHADWILPPRPTQARMMFEQCLLDHGLAPIAPVIESMSAITNLNLARAGHGLTLMARRTVQASLDDATLVSLPTEGLASIPIVLAHKDNPLRHEAIQQFYAAALRRLTK